MHSLSLLNIWFFFLPVARCPNVTHQEECLLFILMMTLEEGFKGQTWRNRFRKASFFFFIFSYFAGTFFFICSKHVHFSHRCTFMIVSLKFLSDNPNMCYLEVVKAGIHPSLFLVLEGKLSIFHL